MYSRLGIGGNVAARKNAHISRVSFAWKLRNIFTWRFIKNFIAFHACRIFSAITGATTAIGSLGVRLRKQDGSIVDYGAVAYGVVTTAFVNGMVDQMQSEDSSWGDFKYHDSGVGTTGAAVGDTGIETTDWVDSKANAT